MGEVVVTRTSAKEQRSYRVGIRTERHKERLLEFEFGRLRVPDERTHRLLLRAGRDGSY